MNLFKPFYLKLSRKRFIRQFNPIGIRKGSVCLISPPDEIKDFFKMLSFLGALHHIGKVVLLAPLKYESTLQVLKPTLFQPIFYDRKPAVLTKEFDFLKKELAQWHFQSLIELNIPANVHLPYLVNAERRFAFFHENIFPYYNILVRGNIEGFHDFFQIQKEDLRKYFRFLKPELKNISQTLPKNKPLIFVNGSLKSEWQGDRVVWDRESQNQETAYKMLSLCDAYAGKEDEMAEFARIFGKQIAE